MEKVIKVRFGWKSMCDGLTEYKDAHDSIEEAAQEIQEMYDRDNSYFNDDFEEYDNNLIGIYAEYPFDLTGVIKEFIYDIPDLIEERLCDNGVEEPDVYVDKGYAEAMYNAIKPVLDKHMSGLFEYIYNEDAVAWYNPITRELKVTDKRFKKEDKL